MVTCGFEVSASLPFAAAMASPPKRTADPELREASGRVLDKIAAAVPAPLREAIVSRSLYAWGRVAEVPEAIDFR